MEKRTGSPPWSLSGTAPIKVENHQLPVEFNISMRKPFGCLVAFISSLAFSGAMVPP